MDEINTLEWIERIGSLLLSFPLVIILILILYRKSIVKILSRFTDDNLVKAKVGPIELERKLEVIVEKGNSAVDRLNKINDLMAKSRQLELEIITGMFQMALPQEQKELLQEHIREFRKLNEESIASESR